MEGIGGLDFEWRLARAVLEPNEAGITQDCDRVRRSDFVGSEFCLQLEDSVNEWHGSGLELQSQARRV